MLSLSLMPGENYAMGQSHDGCNVNQCWVNLVELRNAMMNTAIFHGGYHIKRVLLDHGPW